MCVFMCASKKGLSEAVFGLVRQNVRNAGVVVLIVLAARRCYDTGALATKTDYEDNCKRPHCLKCAMRALPSGSECVSPSRFSSTFLMVPVKLNGGLYSGQTGLVLSEPISRPSATA